jgi:hypothetical protein
VRGNARFADRRLWVGEQLAVLHAQHGLRQPVLAIHDLGEEIALDAIEAAVDRRIRVAPGRDHAPVLRAGDRAAEPVNLFECVEGGRAVRVLGCDHDAAALANGVNVHARDLAQGRKDFRLPGRLGLDKDATNIHASTSPAWDPAIVTAPTGQGATQAPQPVQTARSIVMAEPPPSCGRKWIASRWQASWHRRHVTPCISMQEGPTEAAMCHGLALRSGAKHPSVQLSAQAPQNVQAPRLKSTAG